MAQTSHSFAEEYTSPWAFLVFFVPIHVHIPVACMLGSAVEEHELQLLQATFKDLAGRSGTDRGTKGITADVLSRYLPLPGLLGGMCSTTRATLDISAAIVLAAAALALGRSCPCRALRTISLLALTHVIFTEQLFHVFDKSGTGYVVWEDFVEVMSKACRGPKSVRHRFVFEMCDWNQAGHVAIADLSAVLAHVPPLILNVLARAHGLECTAGPDGSAPTPTLAASKLPAAIAEMAVRTYAQDKASGKLLFPGFSAWLDGAGSSFVEFISLVLPFDVTPTQPGHPGMKSTYSAPAGRSSPSREHAGSFNSGARAAGLSASSPSQTATTRHGTPGQPALGEEPSWTSAPPVLTLQQQPSASIANASTHSCISQVAAGSLRAAVPDRPQPMVSLLPPSRKPRGISDTFNALPPAGLSARTDMQVVRGVPAQAAFRLKCTSCNTNTYADATTGLLFTAGSEARFEFGLGWTISIPVRAPAAERRSRAHSPDSPGLSASQGSPLPACRSPTRPSGANAGETTPGRAAEQLAGEGRAASAGLAFSQDGWNRRARRAESTEGGSSVLADALAASGVPQTGSNSSGTDEQLSPNLRAAISYTASKPPTSPEAPLLPPAIRGGVASGAESVHSAAETDGSSARNSMRQVRQARRTVVQRCCPACASERKADDWQTVPGLRNRAHSANSQRDLELHKLLSTASSAQMRSRADSSGSSVSRCSKWSCASIPSLTSLQPQDDDVVAERLASSGAGSDFVFDEVDDQLSPDTDGDAWHTEPYCEAMARFANAPAPPSQLDAPDQPLRDSASDQDLFFVGWGGRIGAGDDSDDDQYEDAVVPVREDELSLSIGMPSSSPVSASGLCTGSSSRAGGDGAASPLDMPPLDLGSTAPGAGLQPIHVPKSTTGATSKPASSSQSVQGQHLPGSLGLLADQIQAWSEQHGQDCTNPRIANHAERAWMHLQAAMREYEGGPAAAVAGMAAPSWRRKRAGSAEGLTPRNSNSSSMVNIDRLLSHNSHERGEITTVAAPEPPATGGRARSISYSGPGYMDTGLLPSGEAAQTYAEYHRPVVHGPGLPPLLAPRPGAVSAGAGPFAGANAIMSHGGSVTPATALAMVASATPAAIAPSPVLGAMMTPPVWLPNAGTSDAPRSTALVGKSPALASMSAARVMPGLGAGAARALALTGTTVVEHSGWLWKKGARLSIMTKRWYFLAANFLYYYSNPNESTPRGVLFLEGSIVEPVDTVDTDNGMWGLTIRTASAHGERRRRLYARSKRDRNEWLEVLRLACRAAPFEEEYKLGRELGYGQFSRVYAASHISTGAPVAVKIIEKQKLTEAERELLRTEIAILRMVAHPHIIRLEDVFETGDTMYIVTELLTGGELFENIVGRSRFTEAETRALARPLVDAIAYLHALGIVHRDVKPENILCGDSIAEVKICDFGLSKLLRPKETLTVPAGTLTYIAPEVLEAKPYDKAADMWSVGVILFLVTQGRLPFEGSSRHEIAKGIVKRKLQFTTGVWATWSEEGRDFISGLLARDPAERLTARQALQHPWLKASSSGQEPFKSEDEMAAERRRSAHARKPSRAMSGKKR